MSTPIPPTPTGAPETPAQEFRAKVERPHASFEHPTEVVVDPALSKREKVRILDTLEQDARQLSAASDEGMGGGEAIGLHEVLAAKDALQLPPAELAAAVLVQSMESRLAKIEGTEEHITLTHAIDAISAANAAISHMAKSGPTPTHKPQDDAETAVQGPAAAADTKRDH
jgi:hypothetical protein